MAGEGRFRSVLEEEGGVAEGVAEGDEEGVGGATDRAQRIPAVYT